MKATIELLPTRTEYGVIYKFEVQPDWEEISFFRNFSENIIGGQTPGERDEYNPISISDFSK